VKAGGGLYYDRYSVNGRDEWLMRIGEAEAPPILFLSPLLEEMNRTRALLAGIMRAVAARGFGCWLPDLPGTGESERALEDCDWTDWRDAAREAGHCAARTSGKPVVVASIRGGVLLEDAVEASGYWRFAPVDGASLARDLARSKLAGGGGSAGYPTPDALLSALAAAAFAEPQKLRTLRLASDPRDADLKLDGPALWRRSEPDTSSELCEALAADIAEWAAQCVAC